MTAATFGDLMGPARGHLDNAAGVASTAALHSGSVIAAARVTGGLALTLSHYLDDIAPYSVAEAITSSDLNAPLRAAVDARVALQMTAESLRAAGKDHGVLSSEPQDLLTAHLVAAATSLAAGRDVLRTHFSTDPDGWRQHLDWAAVITSVPVARALLAEVASWSRQLAFVTGWLSLASAPDPAIPDPARQGLAGAYHWLLTSCAAITAGQRDDPATAADTELMRAIPVSIPPERQPPQDLETVGELAGGVAISAARLRTIAQAAPEEAAWSMVMTAESWRWTATGAAVICHISELTLRSLAEHPGLAAGTSEAGPQPGSAAEAAADACARWREVAAAWSQKTTGTRGLTAPGIADTGDLLVRLGRLAFTDPQWTPVRSRRASLRDQTDLAPDTAQAAVVVGAVHHAADTRPAWPPPTCAPSAPRSGPAGSMRPPGRSPSITTCRTGTETPPRQTPPHYSTPTRKPPAPPIAWSRTWTRSLSP